MKSPRANQQLPSRKNEKGSALIMAYAISTAILIVGGSLSLQSIWQYRTIQRQRDNMQTFYVAEGGINFAKQTFYQALVDATGGTALNFSWFNDWCINKSDTNGNGAIDENDVCNVPVTANLPALNQLQLDNAYPDSIFSIQVLDVDTSNLEYGDIKIKVCSKTGGNVALDPCTTTDSTATANRTITAVIRFQLGQSPVFDYGYFINNFGYWWGGPLNVNADMRANGDFELNGQPNVNGDVYASANAESGAVGDIPCDNSPCTNSDTLSEYLNDFNTPLEARPGSPSALDGEEGEYDVEGGYNGTPIFQPQSESITMPYLGDIGFYQSYAQTKNGTLTCPDPLTGDPTVINATFTGVLACAGTSSNPIVINGPVVITDDVILSGKVQGQGTIYAGRNVHIIGNIEYKDDPKWSKPDTDPDYTETTNASKDFLGLAAKGNIIIGDYTDSYHQTWMNNLLSESGTYSVTHEYIIDPSDVSLGYNNCTGTCIPNGGDQSALWFNGDYTLPDGYVREDDTERLFYESTLTETDFQNLLPTNSIERIDAVAYTNHAYAGLLLDSDPAINGAVVSRDEGMVVYPGFHLNYDVRVKKNAFDFYLPRSILFPVTQYWEEPSL